jgi:hypothetical protein
MKILNQGIRAMTSISRASFAVLLSLLLAWVPAASAQQKQFATPDEAMNAFGTAVAINDEEAMKGLLGKDFRSVIPPVGAEVRSAFLTAWSQSHAIKPEGDAKASITVGTEGWTLPVPLVKTAQGWQFDTVAGADEMRIRRIGRNELAVMQVMLAIHDAQNEYAEKDRDGDGVRAYAAKFESSPGKTDGLYWPTKAGEAPSPLGPVFAAAKAAGGSKAMGYYGYRYKLLSGQGKNAPGGAYDYLAKGKKLGGFAVAAWPVKYGDTGVMSFMISHDGVLYEKDLGMQTEQKANTLTRFDPDSSWRKVQPSY